MATPIARALDANHDDTFGRGIQNYVSGTKATAQRLRCLFLLVQGEWFLDTSAGIPWFQQDGSDVVPILGGRPFDRSYAEAVMKAKTLELNGIKSITSFDLIEDRNARSLTMSETVTDDDGDIFSITLPVP